MFLKVDNVGGERMSSNRLLQTTGPAGWVGNGSEIFVFSGLGWANENRFLRQIKEMIKHYNIIRRL